MLVRMKTKVSGTRDGVEWPERGEVVDLPEGAELIAAGLAEAVDDVLVGEQGPEVVDLPEGAELIAAGDVESEGNEDAESAAELAEVETAEADAAEVETAVVETKPKRRRRP